MDILYINYHYCHCILSMYYYRFHKLHSISYHSIDLGNWLYKYLWRYFCKCLKHRLRDIKNCSNKEYYYNLYNYWNLCHYRLCNYFHRLCRFNLFHLDIHYYHKRKHIWMMNLGNNLFCRFDNYFREFHYKFYNLKSIVNRFSIQYLYNNNLFGRKKRIHLLVKNCWYHIRCNYYYLGHYSYNIKNYN